MNEFMTVFSFKHNYIEFAFSCFYLCLSADGEKVWLWDGVRGNG